MVHTMTRDSTGVVGLLTQNSTRLLKYASGTSLIYSNYHFRQKLWSWWMGRGAVVHISAGHGACQSAPILPPFQCTFDYFGCSNICTGFVFATNQPEQTTAIKPSLEINVAVCHLGMHHTYSISHFVKMPISWHARTHPWEISILACLRSSSLIPFKKYIHMNFFSHGGTWIPCVCVRACVRQTDRQTDKEFSIHAFFPQGSTQNSLCCGWISNSIHPLAFFLARNHNPCLLQALPPPQPGEHYLLTHYRRQDGLSLALWCI